MIYKVIYSGSALNDIDKIYEYIAYELLVPETAKEQIDRIIKAIDALETFPYRYKIYDEEPWLSQGIRCFTIDNYMVFYYPLENDGIIRVLRIIYGGRDIKTVLSK